MKGFFRDGVLHPTVFDVRTWEDHGLRFPTNLRRRRTQYVVAHWTGAENPPEDVYRNMNAAKNALGLSEPKSVHFVVDPAGLIYQFADAETFCAHARGVNDRSVGIEFICRGDDENVRTRGVDRENVTEVIQGEPVTYAAFTPAQVTTGLQLVRALCEAYELPMQVPVEGGDVYPRALSTAKLNRFRGVIGHLHVKKGKRDCGLRFLRAVHARGASLSNLRA